MSRLCCAPGSVITVPSSVVVEVLVAKLSFLAGFGAGYVLGARAGRERYEQIRRGWENAKDDPRLQSLAGMAQARADDVVASLRNRMGNDNPR
ncbi:MAG: uncharacterized protein JWP40_4208 [Blastococcus sp.]|jgi:hypothetical protein|nr:uncharacterized protein [Blastococcus sp.]